MAMVRQQQQQHYCNSSSRCGSFSDGSTCDVSGSSMLRMNGSESPTMEVSEENLQQQQQQQQQ
jgi:hypothetical protein